MAEQVAKLKKRQWYPIIAPKQFEHVVLGETLVNDPNAMLGKTLSHSLMNLTNDSKRQNVNIHFKVVEVEGDKAKTKIIGYQIIPSSVKRFVRRNSEKMDISFTCDTADNVFIRVKPLVITKADVKGSVAARLRNSIASFLSKTIKKMTYDELINDLILHKLQSLMRENLNKIYPLKVCEIRYVGLEDRDRPQEAKVEAETAEQK
ncbi:hypothetical protein HYX08_03010 [Candidatus Woesearchaeota archaeon]|nr:hypothetical protein [Candidatus Woesearchaeota archaeon]